MAAVSSYEIIFPDSREIIIVNAQPGEHVDNLLIINPSQSPTQEPPMMIQSVLFGDDGGPAFTTRVMELKTTDDGPVATPVVSLDDDQSNAALDHEKCVMITNYIMAYESQKMLQEHCTGDQNDNNDDNEVEEEEEVCVICQGGCETGEMLAVLECRHSYHEDCLAKWLKQKNDCPICRAEVIPFVSIIRRSIY